MCGVAGFIGSSNRAKATYEVITNLFDLLESRGTDASGVWATESGKEGKVYYHKEPIKSSEFIKTDFWKILRKQKINLFLAHARATSKGGGNASTNSNNHPFVSSDRRIGMIHNGTIDEATYLSKRYQCLSETDSEVLLRIFENGLDNKVELDKISDYISHRLNGIKDIWATITEGGMAVAIGERDDSIRNLILFRNDKRPLWIADLRESLGQVFFFSSPDIWYRAIRCCSESTKNAIKDQKIIEVPNNEVWIFSVDECDPQVQCKHQFYRFGVDVKTTGTDWDESEYFSVKPPKDTLSVITGLTDKEEIIIEKEIDSSELSLIILKPEKQLNIEIDDKYDNYYIDERISMHEPICDQIIRLVEDIRTLTNNAFLEGTMGSVEYQEIFDSLESTKTDLMGTLRLIDN